MGIDYSNASKINPFDIFEYPYCHSGHQYALDVVEGKIPNSKFIIGAAKRYLKDLEDGKYPFDAERAERYLRLVQKFEHVKGKWKTKNIEYAPWQNWVWMNCEGFINPVTGFRRFRVFHLEIPRGQGKRHPASQIVQTPDGRKTWGEIEVGSKLYGSDGFPTTVIAKTPIVKDRVYEVHFNDGSVIRCSREHLWTTSTSNQRNMARHRKKNPPKRENKDGHLVARPLETPRETQEIARTLKFAGESNHSVKMAKPVAGGGLKLPIDPYFLGYWLGNGDSSRGFVSCHSQVVMHLQRNFHARGITSNYSVTKDEGNSARVFTNGQVAKLREIGVLNNKHFNLDWIRLSKEDRWDLLRGLIDSDGAVGKDGVCCFYNSNKSIIDGTKILVQSLGMRAVLREKKVSKSNNFKTSKKHYVVSFTPSRGDVVSLFKYKQERLDARADTEEKYNKRYIVDVVETDVYEDMFCVTVDAPDSLYLIGDEFIPTHNSPMASQALLFHLALDDPKGNEIACVATKSDQARIVLDSARAMAEKSESYLRATNVKVLAHKLVHAASHSSAVALSSYSKSLDGRSDIVSIIDELHAVSKPLFEVIYSGMSKRQDSFLLCITTAGFDTDSIGYSQSAYAKRVALGETEDDTFLAIVYTCDETDDIFSEEAWRKANPGFGISVDPITFAAKANKAKIAPEDLPNFKVKHLNMWLNQASAYYSRARWDKCQRPLDIRDFIGCPVRMGLDLASTTDLASIGYVFKDGGKYYVFDRSYIPEETVKRAHSPLYDKCVAQGFLTATPGEVISHEIIREQILKDSKDFKIEACYFDKWAATEMSQTLAKEYINMVTFGMNVANLSEPTKRLNTLMLKEEIHHLGSPLLRWCIGNVVCKEDHNQNVYPRKEGEKFKIDPVIAILMGLAGWLQEEGDESSYENRDIIII